MDDIQALLTRAYDSYNRRDFATFAAQLTPDVDWPNQLDGGRLIGREAIAAYWAQQDRTLQIDVALIGFSIAPDGRLLVEVNQIVRNASGQVWSDTRLQHSVVLRDGLVARLDVSPLPEPVMSDEAALIERLQAALNAKDLEGVTALIHPDVAFPDYLDGGEVRGIGGARDFYQRLFNTLSPATDIVGLERLADGRWRAEMQVSVHDSGGRLWSDTRVAVTYEILDGLIKSLDLGEAP